MCIEGKSIYRWMVMVECVKLDVNLVNIWFVDGLKFYIKKLRFFFVVCMRLELSKSCWRCLEGGFMVWW